MAVIVLDKHHKPLMPCSEKRARQLLERKRARVHKLHPFTIRLVDRLLKDSIVTDNVSSVTPKSTEVERAVTPPQEGDLSISESPLGATQ